MKRNKKKEKITFLLLLLLGISIGFAALTTTLKINGNASITKNTWNIYWDNIDNQDGVTPTKSEIVNEDDTHKKNIVNFEVTFEKPGDYYEFTVDAVNAGTIDAEILSIEKKFDGTVISQENPLPSYLKYEVTYEDGSEIKVADKLAKRTDTSTFTRKTYKIRVEYDRDAVTNSDVNNQVGDVTHTFDFKVTYGQSTSSDEDDPVAAIMREIEADPDGHRDPEQDIENTDIAIDENGNVINLDWWTDTSDPYSEPIKDYEIKKDYDENWNVVRTYEEITLGLANKIVTTATASENIVNGEMIAPIPAYIMLGDVGEFYPVTEIAYVFSNGYEPFEDTVISKFPKLPSTITRIGENAFCWLGGFENVEIPKQIEYIDSGAFMDAYNGSGENNTLTFENGSQLKRIEESGFYRNYIKGDLTLPSTVTYIGINAFTENSFTSISFPTSAQYFTDYYYDDPNYGQVGPYGSFDDNVTLIRY